MFLNTITTHHADYCFSQLLCFRPNNLTMLFVICKRIPQQAQLRFVVESATLLIFFDLLCCHIFHKQIAKTLHRSKTLMKQASLRNPQKICGIRNSLWVPQLSDNICVLSVYAVAEFRYCKRNPLAVTKSSTTIFAIQCTVWPRNEKFARQMYGYW